LDGGHGIFASSQATDASKWGNEDCGCSVAVNSVAICVLVIIVWKINVCRVSKTLILTAVGVWDGAIVVQIVPRRLAIGRQASSDITRYDNIRELVATSVYQSFRTGKVSAPAAVVRCVEVGFATRLAGAITPAFEAFAVSARALSTGRYGIEFGFPWANVRGIGGASGSDRAAPAAVQRTSRDLGFAAIGEKPVAIR
jgi:hypothetical protein